MFFQNLMILLYVSTPSFDTYQRVTYHPQRSLPIRIWQNLFNQRYNKPTT